MKGLLRFIFFLPVFMVIAAGSCRAEIGACCIYPTYDCFLLTEVQCDQHGGVWFEGSCDPNP